MKTQPDSNRIIRWHLQRPMQLQTIAQAVFMLFFNEFLTPVNWTDKH